MVDRASKALWLFCFLLPPVQATCYTTFGDIQDGDVPCDPDNDVSTCCSANDYCLSNGLCLDASANNVMTQQSCTDPNWGAPCHKFCTKHNNGYDGEIAVLPCDQSWDGGVEISYCCDPDAAACCSSSSWFSVPVGTVVRAPVVSSTARTSSPTTSVTHSDTSPSSKTTSPPPKNSNSGSGSGSGSNSNSDSGSNSDSLKIGLGVGLGVGIPVVLALAGVVAFLAIKLRKMEQMTAQYVPQQQMPKTEMPVDQYRYEMPDSRSY